MVGQAQPRSQLKEWNNKIYEMSRKLQNKTSRHQVQNQKNIGNKNQRIGQWQNWKRTRQDKPRGFTGIYLTIHSFIQQEEI